MIITSILLGASAIIGVGLIAAFWNNMLDWLKRAVSKVKEIVNAIIYGTKVFIKKFNEGVKEISKHYSQNEVGKWKETIVSREVSESEIPNDILKKAKMMSGEEVEITKELELNLA